MRSPGWARRCPRWSRVSSSTWRGGRRWPRGGGARERWPWPPPRAGAPVLSTRRASAAAGTPARPVAEDIVPVDAPELFARYESSPEGLSGEEAHRRLRRYGPNELPSPRPPHPLRLLFSQVSHTPDLLP